MNPSNDEGRDDQNLHVREVVERFEQRRAAVKDDVVMVVRPPEPHRARRILLRQFVDHPAQTVGVVDDLVRNQVRPEHFEVLVGDDERDVVAVGDDVLNERVLHRTAHHVAVDPLHGVRPQRHVVLLLLLEPLGHVVGVEQRDHAEGYAHDDNHHAVAEREYVAADLHAVGLFARRVLLGDDAGVFRAVAEYLRGAQYLRIVFERVFDDPFGVPVAHD